MPDWTKICSGCGECCGPVPFEESFLLQNAHKYQEQPIEIDDEMFTGLFVPLTATMNCVFLNKISKRCEVYNERPIVCRLQGTIPELPCPKLPMTEPEEESVFSDNPDWYLRMVEDQKRGYADYE